MPPREHDYSHRHLLFRPLWLRGFRRRHRWLFRTILVLPLLLAAAVIVMMRSPLAAAIIVPQIERALNLKVEADSIYVNSSGEVVMTRASFLLPGVPGPAGRFLRVTRVTADVDWWSTITGQTRFRSIQMVEPVVTVSQSLDDRSLNLGALDLPESSGRMAIPAITAVDAGLELGEHRGRSYKPLKHVVMNGRFAPVKEPAGAYEFGLRERTMRVRRPGGPAEQGVRLAGRLYPDGVIDGAIENFSLSDWPPESVPSPVRELFADLDLAGDVPRSTFRFTPGEGLRAELELRGVGMNLPVGSGDYLDPTQPPVMGPPPRSMRMHGVNGTITFTKDSVTAAVDGLIEDMPYRVNLAYRGTEVYSPFVCEFESRNFRVERNPALLPYAPAKVSEYLQLFSSPTALVSTRMTVSRGEPVNGQEGEYRFFGTVELSEGVAAFERFPYEFRNMTGVFQFDNDSVEIVRVSGESESGARLSATGRVAPLDDTAEITVNVDVHGAPIDETLGAAFGPEREGIVAALFNKQRHDQLVEAGLVRTPEHAEAERAELAQLEADLKRQTGEEAASIRGQIAHLKRRAAIPVFAFRGKTDVKVLAHSPRGRGSEWVTEIDIHFPRAGLVPEKFPYPIVGEDVHIRVVDSDGRMVKGNFRGLTGGTAEVAASFVVPERAWEDQDAHPVIHIGARGLPLDELLINALPGPDGALADHNSLKPLLRRLRLSGRGDADVRIADRMERPGAPTGFDAEVRIAGARADPAPRAGSAPLSITEIAGRIGASEDRLELDLSGQPRLGVPASPDVHVSGALSLRASAEFIGSGEEGRTDYRVRTECHGMSMEAPVECLVAVFSEDGARRIAELRSARRPTGTVDAAVNVEVARGEPAQVDVELANPRDLEIDLLGGRLAMPWAKGTAWVSADDGVVSFAEVRGPISFEGEPTGELRLDGAYAIGEAGGPVELELGVRDGVFESPFIYRVLEARLGREEAMSFGGYRPRGRFDADVVVTSGGAAEGARGRIMPRTLTADFDGRPVVFDSLKGAVEFEPGAGKLRGLSAGTRDWTIRADGAWRLGEQGAFEVRTGLSIHGRRFSPELKAMLPAGVRGAMEQLELDVQGRFVLSDALLTVGRGSEGDWAQFEGDIDFEGASLETGLPIRGLSGRMHARVDDEPADRPVRFRVDVDADSFSAAGVYVRDGRAVVTSGARPGQVLVRCEGECYGGKVSARAEVSPVGPQEGAPRRLDAELKLAGTRFAPLMESLTAGVGREGPPAPDAAAEADFSRGVLDADLTLTGLVGHPETRRGRGAMRISGGRIVSLPGAMRLVEVSNLQLPSNSNLDYARASFFVDGGTVNFDEVSVLSSSVEIVGWGTMTWPSQALNFRFNSRSARPIPLISRLVQGIRDELITTSVTGVLSDPVVTLQQFPGPRRMLGRSLGASDEAAKRAADLERRTEALEARARRRGAGIPVSPVRP